METDGRDKPYALDHARRRRIIDTLGEMPREALLAMVDLGLSDGEIGRYYKLAPEVVTRLRTRWGIEAQV